jgi:hypothetical protein
MLDYTVYALRTITLDYAFYANGLRSEDNFYANGLGNFVDFGLTL